MNLRKNTLIHNFLKTDATSFCSKLSNKLMQYLVYICQENSPQILSVCYAAPELHVTCILSVQQQ